MKRSMGLSPTPEDAAAHATLQIQRWKELYDEDVHIKLQCAVMDQVALTSVKRRAAKLRRRAALQSQV